MTKQNVLFDASEGGLEVKAAEIADTLVCICNSVADDDQVVATVVQGDAEDLIVVCQKGHDAESIAEALLNKRKEQLEARAAVMPPVAVEAVEPALEETPAEPVPPLNVEVEPEAVEAEAPEKKSRKK